MALSFIGPEILADQKKNIGPTPLPASLTTVFNSTSSRLASETLALRSIPYGSWDRPSFHLKLCAPLLVHPVSTMATALQKQLAAIAVSSTHQLDLRAQKAAHGKSLLFEPKVAASQSFDQLYLICHEGYRDLCALDPRFLHFSKSLFSEQSKVEDRTHMTAADNAKLDTVIDAFLTLIAPRLLLRPAEKALEWLVRRFKVHEYNTECLVLTYLPYHNTPQFLALLSILSPHPQPALRFLFPYIQSPTNPPRRTIAYTAITTLTFFRAYQSHVTKVVKAGHQYAHMLSFWSSITVEAVFGILNNSSTGRRDVQDQKMEELVLEVLPVLNNCMRAKHGAETVTACYAIVVILVTQAKVGDKVLDGLMEAVLLAHDDSSLIECLACLAMIAGERTTAQIPDKVYRRLLKIPQLCSKLALVSQQCHVERLALGCALGALSGVARSEESRSTLDELLESRLLSESKTQIVLSTLLQLLGKSQPGSEEHAELLGFTTHLTEMKQLIGVLSDTAKQSNFDMESLGILATPSSEVAKIDATDSEDELMLDPEDNSTIDKDLYIDSPTVSVTSFLAIKSDADFASVAEAFEKAVSVKQTKHYLQSKALCHNEAAENPLYLSFLARIWSSRRTIPVRLAALQATKSAVEQVHNARALQNLLPYLVHALTDPSSLIRRSAAACVATISGMSSATPKENISGIPNFYGDMSKTLTLLKQEEVSTLLMSIIRPILEECVMDSHFIIPAIRDSLEGSQTSKSHPKHAVKAQQRTSILSFFARHAGLTPLLNVRLSLLPMFAFMGKISDTVRITTVLPFVQEWCSLPSAEVTMRCEANGGLSLGDADRAHLAVLLPKDSRSAQLLQEIISGAHNQDRSLLANAAFDRIAALWLNFRSEIRLALAQSMLDLSFSEKNQEFNRVCRERAFETLRSVPLDSATLVTLLESVPSVVQMPEGPPAKKRRRTSRNEMARVELSSQDELQRLLRKLTFVLELIEGSNPGRHPALFQNLFTVFGELQPLKQQSGSELVYLQSMILGSLAPIVDTLKAYTAGYQSAVRADLLIDCIRHSPSPQVQNSALLLIANLASWVPDLILHNLMPIFTFIGSTLLRQQDEYSAQVVDKTISRVVPQLAASLRSKHKNFLTGVSDLLLSFTAAFEHIPSHRRLKLFSELARTLGPEDALSAIVALLADRHQSNKTHRKFSTDLLLAFDPIHTLDAFRGFLDLVIDAAAPKRKVADTLFGLNEKQPAQIESAIRNLLSCLTDLATEDRLRAHVTRAFRRRDDTSRPREVFASIVEATIQLSRKVASSPKLYEACSRVLAKCLDLLPTSDLVQSAALLLENRDSQVQVAAVRAVEVRAGTAVQNDRKSVQALLSFLPSVERLLQESPDMEAKIISVSCIDRIIERFGKKDLKAIASVAQSISGSQALSSSDDRVRVLSLLCLTSVFDVLEDEAISLLPKILPTAFEYLSQAVGQEKSGLHNAVFTLLSNIVERLGYMFSRDYLVTALQLSHRSASASLENTCDESRLGFYQSISEHLSAQEVFVAIKGTWQHAVSQGFNASLEHLELLRSTINSQTKAKLIKASSTLFSLLLQIFRLREVTGPQSDGQFDEEELEQLDDTLVDSVVAMVLKLNDATFRPFFIQLVDQEGPQRSITFYKFLAVFFDKFKSIVTTYSSYLIDHIAKTLVWLATADSEPNLRRALLTALQKSFQHDQDGFWQAPSHFGTIMPPLLALLTLPSAATSTPSHNTNNAIPTITDLAAASSSSIDNHREMNAILLRYMRSDAPHTRLATVLCQQSLTSRLGEEWLGLLPEMLPFISELREDDDEMVERETQRWISGVEEVLGESLEGMLQ
ncbi:hypothetical protein [Plenodomus lingam JN3]|uniref:U3 small nucleolar RNA-associated protein 10 n=1 Tax=Leptosphaeria maculans (strain JN3 / isolate v23.1.3 / race Av1-4-5-6-7-8) TaxID=985895 RepID=M1ZIT2_LEPMJ|nr:hypothetical protein [Plenodomus lingam JN3]